MDTVMAARILRLGVIRNMWQQGLLEESDAKELLAGPLEPGNESTICDDSAFLNDPEGLIRAAEHRKEAEGEQGGAIPTEDDTVTVGRIQDERHTWL